ncbi:MAG: hypothetical protein RR475_10465 [Clostridia bacterium]
MLDLDATVLRDLTVWIALMVGSGMLIGLAPSLMRTGAKRSDPSVAAALFGTVLALCAIGIAALSGAFSLPQNTQLIWLMLSGFFTGLVWLCLFTALTGGLTSKVIPLVQVSIVPVLVACHFLIGTPMSLWRISALLVVLLGTVFIESRTKALRGQLWLIYAGIAALAYAGLDLIQRTSLAGMNLQLFHLFRTGIACMWLWAFVLLRGKQKSFAGMKCKAWVAIPCSAVAVAGCWLCNYGISLRGDGGRFAPLSILGYFMMLLFARVIQKERQPGSAIFGALLVLFGMFVLAIGW